MKPAVTSLQPGHRFPTASARQASPLPQSKASALHPRARGSTPHLTPRPGPALRRAQSNADEKGGFLANAPGKPAIGRLTVSPPSGADAGLTFHQAFRILGGVTGGTQGGMVSHPLFTPEPA